MIKTPSDNSSETALPQAVQLAEQLAELMKLMIDDEDFCWEQDGRERVIALLLRALEGRAQAPAPDLDLVVKAYRDAQENWSGQCFCFTSAPDTMRRAAHEAARDGFNAIAHTLGFVARPILDAEYREAEAQARAEKAAAPPSTGAATPREKL